MTEAPIVSFTGEHAFLSNFAVTPFRLPGQVTEWPTAEHCFQAAKAPDHAGLKRVAAASTPAEAKRLGRSFALPANWEQVKRPVMMSIVLAKFMAEGNARLRERLAETGRRLLVEGNTWGDMYWGAVLAPEDVHMFAPLSAGTQWPDGNGRVLAGQNWLGRILMMVRDLVDSGGREV